MLGGSVVAASPGDIDILVETRRMPVIVRTRRTNWVPPIDARRVRASNDNPGFPARDFDKAFDSMAAGQSIKTLLHFNR